MRFVRGLAIALGLGLTAVGGTVEQQDSSSSANTRGQAQTAAPVAPPSTEKGAVSQTPENAQTAPASPQASGAETKAPEAETPTAMPAGSTPGTQTATTAATNPAADGSPQKKTHGASAGGVRKHHRRTAHAASAAPQKVVVREGGAKEPGAQIAPGMSPEEAARERQNAEQWLGLTDGQLQQLAGRALNPQQQETLGQIRHYIDGARSALKEGDVGRASTLAEKAHLLSDDLARH